MHPSALDLGKKRCHTCGRVQLGGDRCTRCGTSLHSRKNDSIQRCLALCVASIIAYIPANIWPIMTITEFGVAQPTTIFGGVISFWQTKAYPVSIIIFTASVMIPSIKLISLFSLCAVAKGWINIDAKFATKLYWFTELVGRWSMIDIFVVSILVGLIQLGRLMTINAGPAAIAFATMVILTMLAAQSFDPRSIWDQVRKEKNS